MTKNVYFPIKKQPIVGLFCYNNLLFVTNEMNNNEYLIDVYSPHGKLLGISISGKKIYFGGRDVFYSIESDLNDCLYIDIYKQSFQLN